MTQTIGAAGNSDGERSAGEPAGGGMRRRILEGTADLLFHQGFPAVKVEDLSRYIGVSKKTLYNHFPDKYSLLTEALDLCLERIDRQLTEIAGSGIDFVDRLKKIMEYAFSLILTRQKLFSGEEEGTPEPLRRKIMDFIRSKVLEIVSVLVDEGIETGAVRTDFPRRFIPYFYLAVIEGSLSLFRLPDTGIERERMLAESVRITFEGVLTEEGRRKLKAD